MNVPFLLYVSLFSLFQGRGDGRHWASVQTETEALHTENQNEGALLTPEDLANYLKCGRTYAYRLLALGEIPSLKLGKLRRIRRQDAERYIEKKVSGGHER